MTGLSFRTALDGDLDRLIDLHTSAYPDPRGPLERRRNLVANPRGTLDDLHVAIVDGQIVAHAFLFSMKGWFAGGAVPVGAIASVAVAPEARGRGIATAMLSHLHARADAAKACVTTLYPFRQGFYAKHGYAAVTPNRRLALDPASIPAAWRVEPGITVRAPRTDAGGDRAAIERMYARAAARGHGWLARPTALWDLFFANERRVWVLATREERVIGYVCWSVVQEAVHAATHLVVRELAADDDAARRALLGAVGAQRDQVVSVTIEVDAADPLDRALLDADRAHAGTPDVEHTLGVVAGGPMVRVVDVRRALSTRRYLRDGSLDLAVDGAPLRIDVTKGKAKLSVPKQLRVLLGVDHATLGAILFGGLLPSDAARLGWARGEDAAITHADAILAAPPFFALDGY